MQPRAGAACQLGGGTQGGSALGGRWHAATAHPAALLPSPSPCPACTSFFYNIAAESCILRANECPFNQKVGGWVGGWPRPSRCRCRSVSQPAPSAGARVEMWCACCWHGCLCAAATLDLGRALALHRPCCPVGPRTALQVQVVSAPPARLAPSSGSSLSQPSMRLLWPSARSRAPRPIHPHPPSLHPALHPPPYRAALSTSPTGRCRCPACRASRSAALA